MTPNDYICSARVPETLRPQAFGPWTITRVSVKQMKTICQVLMFKEGVGFDSQTRLHHSTLATLHLKNGEVVMEDSRRELRKHLPIWLNASGRVLVTGLGLGCVVRGLLASKEVKHITVVEIDKQILRVVGHEFASNPRVKLILGDALKVDLRDTFDFAWHDLWTEGDGDDHLQVLHAKLFRRFSSKCGIQGAWGFPRYLKRRMPEWILR